VILGEDYLQELLTRALECIDASPDAGIALEGSIAEGFGNESSDIDFVILRDSRARVAAMPTQLFIDERRVEVRTRSLDDVRREAGSLRAAAAGDRAVARLPYADLDRWQRMAGAFALRNPAVVQSVQQLVPAADLEALISLWFATLARDCSRCAVALSVLGQEHEAVQWIQTALAQAAKSWLAARGETYLGLKWLSRQFARVPDGAAVWERYTRLAAPVGARADLRAPRADLDEHVSECLSFIAELGVTGCSHDPQRISVGFSRNVTTWQIGRRLYVVRARRDVFALGDEARIVWRSLAMRVPIGELVARCPMDAERAGTLIAEFHRLGLLKLRWAGDGGGDIRVRDTCSYSPSETRPIISLAAPESGDGRPSIELLAMPAARFAAAGMALVWANVEIENAREDTLGAIASSQWQVLAVAARRMVRKASIVLRSAWGVVVLPGAATGETAHARNTDWQGREADEEACSWLTAIPGLPADLVATLTAMEAHSEVRDEREARALLDDLDAVVAQVRLLVGASTFPSSFASAAGWRETVEIGYDWIRLGAFLDSAFPIDEAREVLAGGVAS
jgi:predicted nucleotidyltransferase